MKKFERIIHHGELKDGKLVLDNERWFNGMLSLYDDTKVVIHVERRKKSRSKEQNNYYWGVILPEFSEHTGHSPEELHEIFKSKYLRLKKLWRGAYITTLRSTTDLTTNEFAEYLTNLIVEAGEMGIEIPDADKAYQFRETLNESKTSERSTHGKENSRVPVPR